MSAGHPRFALHAKIPVLRDFGIEIIAMGAAAIMLLLHAQGRREGSRARRMVARVLFRGAVRRDRCDGTRRRAASDRKLLDALTTKTGAIGLMWLTAIFSSVTDNIPLAAMLGKIFGPTPEAAEAVAKTQWWAVVFGANLGGNITPIGSASTVVACTIMKKNKMKVSFLDFVKIGGVFASYNCSSPAGNAHPALGPGLVTPAPIRSGRVRQLARADYLVLSPD